MYWTGPYVGGLVLDIGHGMVRGGHAGQRHPSQIWPSSIGIYDGYDIFPLLSTSRSRVDEVQHVKHVDECGNASIDGDLYEHLIRGIYGCRISDKALLEGIKYNKDLGDTPLLLGAHQHDTDCWDDFNRCAMSKRNFNKRYNYDANSVPKHTGNGSDSTPWSSYYYTKAHGDHSGDEESVYSYAEGDINNIEKKTGNTNKAKRRAVSKKDDSSSHLESNELIESVMSSLSFCTSLSCGLGELTSSRPLFIVESNSITRENRAFQTEILFEDLGMPGIFFGNSNKLALYVNGLTSGLVVDVGSSTISLAVVIEDEMCSYREYNVGCDVIDALLLDLLLNTNQNSYSYIMHHPEYSLGTHFIRDFTLEDSMQISQRIFNRTMPWRLFKLHDNIKTLKESILRISNKNIIESKISLPDGNQLNLSKLTPYHLVGLSTEFLFDTKDSYLPKNITVGHFRGLNHAMDELLMENESFRRKDLYTQIVLIGGGVTATGFQERFGNELNSFYSKSMESPLFNAKFRFAQFNSDFERKHASWIGGSILSSLGSFHRCWISREEYNEHGTNISYRKGGI